MLPSNAADWFAAALLRSAAAPLLRRTLLGIPPVSWCDDMLRGEWVKRGELEVEVERGDRVEVRRFC